MVRWLKAAALAPLPLLVAAAPFDADHVLKRHYGNDAPWYRDRIPLFESSDSALDEVYYYRWQVVRAHQRDVGADGYITTEFLGDVPWQRESAATLNDAAVFHIGETRWLRDRRPAADYIDFMYRGGNDRHFSDAMADAVWGRYLVDGDKAGALRHLSAMRLLYGQWDDRFDFGKGLYWIEPLLDATEYTISSVDASGGKDGFRGGDSFRPSINSYMFANARAIAQLIALAGDTRAAARFEARAEAIRARVSDALWSPALTHFVDRYKVTNEYVRYWEPIRGRELVGYVPWAFDLPADEPRYAEAWRHLLDRDGFAGPAGLRTVEPGYQYYMRQYRYEGAARECQWNGPIWPFQTTQVLLGLINLLDHYHQTVVVPADFMRILRQYAVLHRQGDRLDIEEDYDPGTGKPIVGLARSHHYFHSGFNDLVLTGVVGIRPRADDVLEVNPLLPTAGNGQGLAWFMAQDVPYHGRNVTVRWDVDGRHYRSGVGLTVEIDGKVAARLPKLGRITVPLPRMAPASIARPIDRAVQLVRGQYPIPSASSGSDAEAMHDAIDGRLWFFPESVNGWTSGGDGEQWFAVDFGESVTLSGAELAFFAGGGISAPDGVTVQGWHDGAWRDLAQIAAPVANGVTTASWTLATISRLRVTMRAKSGKRIRLIGLKAF